MMDDHTLAYHYEEEHLILNRVGHIEESEFDRVVRQSWTKAAENGCFKYTLKNLQTRITSGKHNLVLQLNIERGTQRRPSANVKSMDMPFDPDKFHFNKIKSEEILCYLRPSDFMQDREHMLIINVSPLEFGHILLVPNTAACFAQRMNLSTATLSLHLILLSAHKGFHVGYNSLCALASVNHLHVHAWYLDHPLSVSCCNVSKLCDRLYITNDHYAAALALQLHGSTVQRLAEDLFTVTNYLQCESIAHNVFITQGPIFGEDPFGPNHTIRVYIWARKSCTGAKVTTNGVAFNVAVAELAGHIPMYDKNAFETMQEDEIVSVIKEQLFSDAQMKPLCDSLRTHFTSQPNCDI